MDQRNETRLRILEFIRSSPSDVFLTRDLAEGKPGSPEYRAALRAILRLLAEGVLARLGYGVYVRMGLSPLTGKPIIAVPGGLDGALRQALDRLDVAWKESRAIEDYNAGRSTQIPVNPMYRVPAGFTRRFSYRGKDVRFERGEV